MDTKYKNYTTLETPLSEVSYNLMPALIME